MVAISIFSSHWSEPYYSLPLPQNQLVIDMFFLVEGFLFALKSARAMPSPVEFLKTRLSAVYPLYVIGLALGACAILLPGLEDGWTMPLWVTALWREAIWIPTMGTVAGGAVYPLNPPAWAVILEVTVIFLLTLGLRTWTLRKAMGGWAIATLVMIGLAVVWYDTNMGWRYPHYWGGAPRMLSGFFGGIVVYQILRRKRLHVPRLPSAIAFLAFWAVQMPHIRFIGLPLFLIALPVILAVAVTARRDRLAMAIAPFAKKYTYGVYLTHYPVMLLCRRGAEAVHIDPDYQSSPLGYLIVLVLVLAVGMAATRVTGALQVALTKRSDRSRARMIIVASSPALARYR